jgi:hypothetical protein
MRGEKLRANLPQFWNNDGKDRPKGQICPLAKKEVFSINKDVKCDICRAYSGEMTPSMDAGDGPVCLTSRKKF